ncbi:MAG TPA: hypothetical protein VH763_20155 [Gemmatimonadales bacterium]
MTDEWRAAMAPRLALVLQAQIAAKGHSVGAGALLDQLDSMLVEGPWIVSVPGNLVSARLHEQQGELPQALAAVRRREFDLDVYPPLEALEREPTDR